MYKKKRKDTIESQITPTATVTETTVSASALGVSENSSIVFTTSAVSTSLDSLETVSTQSSTYSSLTSPNRLQDVKAKLSAPIPVG